MSGTTCAVADCKNIAVSGTPLSFHRFPRDVNFRKAWIVKCKRGDTFNPVTARICSEHFKPEDYERDLMNELLNLPLRKILRKGSIPSVFRSRDKENNVPDNSRRQRVLKRQNKQEVNYLVSIDDDTDQAQPPAPTSSDFSSQVDFRDTKKNEEIHKLKKKVAELQFKVKNLRNRIRLDRLKKQQTHGRNKTFSSAQIKKLKGQQRVNWETADIVKALSLRSVSLKAYETARSTWNLPLPAPSTLRAWVYRFQCSPGIQTDIIKILGEHSTTFGRLTCLCALTFDEMSLDGRYVMDTVNDQISSHSKVQVVMVRGIVDDWKQPVYFGFDVAMTDALLSNIIRELESCQLRVVSITSDMGGENRGLWKFYNISPEKPWFANPTDASRKIFVFADMPHLLKLIRNHLIDDGLMTEDGAVIDRDVMQTLVDSNYEELKLCPKLSQYLINVTGVERMRVRPAAQLLSRHSAMLAKDIYSDTLEIGNFIQTINDGFDVFNSRCHKNSKNPLLSAFGVNMESQLSVLCQLKHFIKTSRFFTKHRAREELKLKSALLPCQFGYLVSIEALLQMYTVLREDYGVEYLLTCRVNQDCLESFFSRIRGFGGPNPNPTPCEFRYRFRLLLLGGSIRAPKASNSLQHCESNYVSADLLDKNKINKFVNPESNFDPKEIVSIPEVEEPSNSRTNEIDYLAGYIAWSLKRKYPSLPRFGTPTGYQRSNTEQPTWIQMLSRGGLLTPNVVLKNAITKCNAVFERAISHLQNLPNLHANLRSCMKAEFPEIQKEIVDEFLKVRVKIRMKHLNAKRMRSLCTRKMKLVLNSYKPKH